MNIPGRDTFVASGCAAHVQIFKSELNCESVVVAKGYLNDSYSADVDQTLYLKWLGYNEKG